MSTPSPLPVAMFVEIYQTGGLGGLHAALGGISGDQKLVILRHLETHGFLVNWTVDPTDAWRMSRGEIVAGPDRREFHP